jgi:hypothetical protein
MPRKLKLESIRSELSSVEALIRESEMIDDPVGKMQYEYKKSLLTSQLDELMNKEETKASVALFFGGKPVFGSRGINVDFAGRNNFKSFC